MSMIRANSSRRLTLAAFTAWLSSKHLRTKVGVSCDEDSCPLAKFLTQTTGIPHLVDGDSYMSAKVEDGKVVKDDDGNIEYEDEIELPQWAQDFVSRIDDGDDYASVSAAHALKIAESSTLGRALGC